MLIGKSLHITWEELACKDEFHTPYPFHDGREIELVVMFERIRAIWNKPLIINSAYRTEVYNVSVGGSPHSQHKLGKALDLQPPEGITIERFHKTLKEMHQVFGIRGLGKYATFCHCDIRDGDKLIEWVG